MDNIGQVDLVSVDNKIYNMAAVAVSDVGTSYDTPLAVGMLTPVTLVTLCQCQHGTTHWSPEVACLKPFSCYMALMMDDNDQILINFDMNCFNRICLMDTFNDIVN